MSQNLLSGKYGYVNTGSSNYSFGKWEADIKAKMVPAPNFNSAGFEQYVVGLIGAKITITGPYDQGNMPFTIPGIGNPPVPYSWTLGLTSSVFFTVPGWLEGIKVAEDVEGNPTITLTVQSTGSFTASIA